MHKGIRTNKVLAVAAAAALVVGVMSAGLVWAQGRGSRGPRPGMGMGPGIGGGMMMAHAMRQLNLTDQQKQQIKGILQQNQDQIKSLSDQAFSDRKALHEAIVANDQGRITTASNELAGVQLNLAQLHAKIRSQIFSEVLTPEQRDKANAMEARAEQRMDQWHQKMEQRLGQWLSGSQQKSNGGGH